ncbi:MAG TPA: hypothetical protein VHE80_09240, partial [Acidimicrobiales bacterium]|nr:hypothetical protein [Acidimicrobiales bacterium]
MDVTGPPQVVVQSRDGGAPPGAGQEAEAAARPTRFPNLRSRTVEAALVVVAVAIPYAWMYRPWGGRWRVPLFYFQDANFHAMLVQNMVLHGRWSSTPDLGAPFGQRLHDFPFGADQLHLVAMKALTVFTRDPFAVTSLYFALSFFLIALSAHVVLRTLGLRPLAAGAVAVLFAFLPYRFWHANARVLLAAYYAVPLGVLLIVWVVTDGIPVSSRGGTGTAWRDRAWRRRVVAVTACVLVVGSASPYYGVFTICILAVVGVLEAVRRASGRPLLAAGVVALGIMFVMVANLAPSLAWRARHGPNPEAMHRTVWDAERYGLRFTQMFLPSERERLSEVLTIGPKARPTEPGEDDAYLGVLGAAGLSMALVIAFAGVLGARRLRIPRLAKCFAAVILVAILFGEVGGLGLFVAALGFTAVRTWSRIVLFVGFCSLGTLALFAQHAAGIFAPGRRSRFVAPIAVVLVVLGLVDQVPKVGVVPAYAATTAEQRSDRSFVASMERDLPTRAMVFQLPVMEFPEGGGRELMWDYDLLKGYLSGTGKLRWSYGGVRGREADWQVGWGRQPVPRMVEGLAAAGFSALYVDRFGFADRGAALDAALRPL